VQLVRMRRARPKEIARVLVDAAAREALGLTPVELATRIGMWTRAYLTWEAGPRKRWGTLMAKVRSLGIRSDAAWLGDTTRGLLWRKPDGPCTEFPYTRVVCGPPHFVAS
jgi:hypothetical protein